MTVWTGEEIDKVVEIIEYLVRGHDYSTSVGQIKKKFNLTNDEYNMIYDLVLPAIRQANMKGYYRTHFRSMERGVDDILDKLINNPGKLTKTKLFELAVEKLQEISLKAEEADVKENETVA